MVRAVRKKISGKQAESENVIKTVDQLWREAQNDLLHSRFDIAKPKLQKIIKLVPNHFVAHHYLGKCYQNEGKIKPAFSHLKKAILNCKNYYPAYIDLAQQHLKRNNAEIVEKEILNLLNDFDDIPELYTCLADTCSSTGNLERAKMYIEKAIALCTNKESEAFQQADIGLVMVSLENNCVVKASAQEDIELEESFYNQLKDPKLCTPNPLFPKGMPSILFYSAYSNQNQRKILEQYSNFARKKWETYNIVSPTVKFIKTSPKIKIAIYSDKINREHAVHWCFGEIINQLDKNKFEIVHLYSDTDLSQLNAKHEIKNLKSLFVGNSLAAFRTALESIQPDILWYPDISISENAYAYAHLRLAPIQCNSLGHPQTTGISTVDYMISSEEIEPEDGQKFYTEKLLRLKGLPSYYRIPENPSDKSRSDFNLPQDKNLYLCSQTHFKIQYIMDDVFYNILEQDPNGCLVFINHKKKFHLHKNRWENNKLKKYMDRILVVEEQSFPDYLALIKSADVFLDTFPFGGGNTCFQSCGMGTPMALIESEQSKGRIGAALYRRMGLDELIGQSEDDYVRNAIKLGTNKAYREKISKHLIENRDKIFEDQKLIDAHNELFERLGREARMKAAS